MQTAPVTSADLARSVIAVPPLARAKNGGASIAENQRLLNWLAAGGISTFMYGGNANFYNIGVMEYPLTLELLSAIAPKDSLVIPSIGPDFGKALDQVAILKSFDFPTAMALPMASATKPAGIATGLRRLADAFRRPILAYVRSEGYIAPKDIGALVADGAVSAVKYGVDRKDPAEDRYLAALVEAVGAARIVSGMGERPAIVHLSRFGLVSFTSGSVCLAPHMSTAILAALKAGDVAAAEALRARYLPFEDIRDAHSQIAVLHDGLTAAGVVDAGPLLPWLANLDAAVFDAMRPVALALREENDRFARRRAA